MTKKARLVLSLLLVVAVVFLLVMFFKNTDIAVLLPKGIIAEKQRNLLIISTLLMMVVVVPVFAMAILFAWKYRASNKSATYRPNWDHNRKLEIVWWGVPFIIIAALAVITWRSTHDLDPYRPLTSDVPPVTIQVVALQWKWLFIYPDQDIATVNYIQFPVDTPVNFEITADAPMNSFWIPQLSGQVYAMNGMVTKLHIMANEAGTYHGSSANISGEGFADMRFTARASTEAEFDDWVRLVKGSPRKLHGGSYEELAEASRNHPVEYYSLSEKDLHHIIVAKFMKPQSEAIVPDETENEHTHD